MALDAGGAGGAGAMRLRLVFDLDGTLVDSAASLAAATNALLSELGRPPLSVATVRGFVGHGVDALTQRALAATGGTPPGALADLQRRLRAIYAVDPVSGVAVYPGARAALAELAAAGHGLAVCTQKPALPARRLLEALGLAPPIAGLTAGDSIPALKPDPRLVRHAAAQIGDGPVLLIGDNEVDAEAASRAGVPFVLHLGGYRHGPLDAIARAASFDRFADLPGIVTRLAAAREAAR
jgi:phosphoglycolate phosphatase